MSKFSLLGLEIASKTSQIVLFPLILKTDPRTRYRYLHTNIWSKDYSYSLTGEHVLRGPVTE